MIASLYAGATAAAAPGLRLVLRYRVRRGKEVSSRLAERRGVDATPRPQGRVLWLHGASVGEAVSVLPVLTALARRAPDVFLLLTTGTVTSAELLAGRLPELGLDGRALHRFVPMDVPAWTGRFLDHWRPDAACFVEQEIWPNLLAGLHRREIPVLLLNARLSARSARRWPLAGPLARKLFGGFAAILAQSAADAERLRALGGRNVSAPGNLKAAAPPLPVDTAELSRMRAMLGTRPVWLAASTHPGEEALLMQTHAALAASRPELLTIIAPRHPRRGAAVALLAAGWPVARRAAGQDFPAGAGVWIADTVGELGLFYRLAPIVFMGGSLVPHGGQNPLEAARLGCAVAVGPHTANFAEIVATLTAAGALTTVRDPGALAAWVGGLLDAPERRAVIGEAARVAARPDEHLPDLAASALLALLERPAAGRA